MSAAPCQHSQRRGCVSAVFHRQRIQICTHPYLVVTQVVEVASYVHVCGVVCMADCRRVHVYVYVWIIFRVRGSELKVVLRLKHDKKSHLRISTHQKAMKHTKQTERKKKGESPHNSTNGGDMSSALFPDPHRVTARRDEIRCALEMSCQTVKAIVQMFKSSILMFNSISENGPSFMDQNGT